MTAYLKSKRCACYTNGLPTGEYKSRCIGVHLIYRARFKAGNFTTGIGAAMFYGFQRHLIDWAFIRIVYSSCQAPVTAGQE